MGKHTDEQKQEAVDVAQTVGINETSRRLGISKSTLAGWMRAAGVVSPRSAHTRAATVQRAADLEQRRVNLAHGLVDDVLRLRTQLFAPCVEKIVKTVGQGEGCTATEIVTVDHTQPTFGDKQRIMVSIGIAVDKIQLLSGAATERVEHRGIPDDRAATELRDELAARRRHSA